MSDKILVRKNGKTAGPDNVYSKIIKLLDDDDGETVITKL